MRAVFTSLVYYLPFFAIHSRVARKCVRQLYLHISNYFEEDAKWSVATVQWSDLPYLFTLPLFFSVSFLFRASMRMYVRGLSIHTNKAQKNLTVWAARLQTNAFEHSRSRRWFAVDDSRNHTSVIFICYRLCTANSISRELKICREVLRVGFCRLNVEKILEIYTMRSRPRGALLSAAVPGWVAIQITVIAADKFRSVAVL